MALLTAPWRNSAFPKTSIPSAVSTPIPRDYCFSATNQGSTRLYWIRMRDIPEPTGRRWKKSPPRRPCKNFPVALLSLVVKPCPAEPGNWIPNPTYPPRDPQIRFRKNVPDCWIALVLTEGKNRQVRRMTAAIGHPTLRLIRVSVGKLALKDLAAGTWKYLNQEETDSLLSPDILF